MAAADSDVLLYHATDAANLDAIRAEGVRPGSYWSATIEMARYYAEAVSDEGGTPAILAVPLATIRESEISVDMPSIVEPITSVLGRDEKSIARAWARSDGSWRESLRIVGSVRVHERIPADALRYEREHDAASDRRFDKLLIRNGDDMAEPAEFKRLTLEDIVSATVIASSTRSDPQGTEAIRRTLATVTLETMVADGTDAPPRTLGALAAEHRISDPNMSKEKSIEWALHDLVFGGFAPCDRDIERAKHDAAERDL